MNTTAFEIFILANRKVVEQEVGDCVRRRAKARRAYGVNPVESGVRGGGECRTRDESGVVGPANIRQAHKSGCTAINTHPLISIRESI